MIPAGSVAVVDVKTRILEAAAEFGDKEGLLAAVVDRGFETYLAGKRAAKPSGDPVRDLRDGWDDHVAFALDYPDHYRLMYSGLSTPPGAAAEAHELLLAVLERCAAAGRPRLPPLAGQMVMAANAGVALSMITRPELCPDPGFSVRVRESVLAGVLAEAGAVERPQWTLSRTAAPVGPFAGAASRFRLPAVAVTGPE
jgi:AcrR family transcriptional regulator